MWFCLVSLFNGISTFEGYLVPKLSLPKDSSTLSNIFGRWIREFKPSKAYSSQVNVTACVMNSRGISVHAFDLVRLRTFRLSTWLIGCKIEAGVNAGARERMEVSLRCHNSPRRYWVTRCGWRHAPEARGSLCENLRKIESGFRRQTRRIDFGARRCEANVRRWGPLELGAKWIRQHRRLCLSSLRRIL